MPRKIPFHRRVMPWLFTLIFLIFAPILVFYTAGYRWNAKKGVVEKNGTVILDSNPNGAEIFLNDQKMDQTTPATLQNIAPGTYTMRMEKPGYYPWEKTLPVTQERVTFANEVYLWPELEPEILFKADTQKLFTNPTFDFLIGLKNNNGKQSLFRYERDRVSEEFKLKENIKITSITWDRSGAQAIIEGMASTTVKTWLLEADPLNLTELTPAKYHFERSELIGMDSNYKLILNSNGAFTKEKHEADIVDLYSDLVIKKLPNEENLVLLMSANADEGMILPPGDWQFFSVDGNEMIFRDGKNWLRIATKTNPYTTTQAYAKNIYSISIKRQTSFLLVRNNELSVWRNLYDPELLYRQSEPILAAGWHPDGFSIYFATDNEVRMMGLDNRDGRIQTTIANFDKIKDVVLVDTDLYIAGTKNQKSGVWKLPLVKKSTLSPLGVLDNAMKF